MDANLDITKLKNILEDITILALVKVKLYKLLLEKGITKLTLEEIKMINLLGRDKDIQNYLKND